MSSNRIAIKFGGASGQGINTAGRMLTQSINRTGLFTFSSREYPSLIKGGVASYQVDISNKEVFSSKRKYQILSTMSEESLHKYLPNLSENGVLIHDGEEIEFTPDEEIHVKKNNLHVIYLNSEKIALENGGTEIMGNAVLLGFIWKLLKQDPQILVEEVLEMLSGKDIDTRRKKSSADTIILYMKELIRIQLPIPTQTHRSLLVTGNEE